LNRFVVRTALAFVASSMLPLAAHAQSFRAYLSVSGSDANPCTVAAPCRLLPSALNAIASGGEIWMLDSANFNSGTVNITKDASILAVPGVVGSLVAFGGGPALNISGGVNVKLRNVVVANNVTNPGTDGVVINGGSLDIVETQVSVPGSGVVATNAIVRAHGSLFRDSGNGIVASGNFTVDVWSSRFSNISSVGVWGHANTAAAAGKISVSDSSFVNAGNSIIANCENATATMKAVISRTSFTEGSYAISIQNLSGSGARGTVTGSTFANHITALYSFGGGILESAGNNTAGGSNGSIANATVTNIGTF